jgi:hypothetical protein
VVINQHFAKGLNVVAAPVLLGEVAHRDFRQVDLDNFGEESRIGFG